MNVMIVDEEYDELKYLDRSIKEYSDCVSDLKLRRSNILSRIYEIPSPTHPLIHVGDRCSFCGHVRTQMDAGYNISGS